METANKLLIEFPITSKCKYLTYKEWKREWRILQIEMQYTVSTLPIRNGNGSGSLPGLVGFV